MKRKFIQKRYVRKKNWAKTPNVSDELPSYFLLECFNPEEAIIKLSLTIRSEGEERNVPFQALIELEPGFNRAKILVSDISRVLDLHSSFNIELIPNEVPDGTTLYFGAMDFVKDISFQPAKSKLCKCVVWDLDNTLWEGTLTEDGADKLKLKLGVFDIIKELDRRGILQSIASKNNVEEALDVLKNFALQEYFLYPQISWEPKGKAVKRIASELNIGLDTLIFIDDSEFEQAQVKAVCPEVKVVAASEYLHLLDMKECQVVITSESANRRKMYQEQVVRKSSQESFDGDYFSFLRDCHIKLYIKSMAVSNLERVHELTQRTNQMNFSGNRYERKVLEEILDINYLHTYVLNCEDCFGSYGTVGFCVVDCRQPRMIDLMFSCRIQSKRVEHTFLSYVIKKYLADTDSGFYVNYRKTSRNAQSGKVFDDFGFEKLEETDGVSLLVFRKDREIPDDNIIKLIVHEGKAETL